MTEMINLREIVLSTLIEILEEEKYSHVVLREVLEKYQYLENCAWNAGKPDSD